MNATKRIVCLFAIGMCIFAGSSMAFDLGGMLKQVEKAAQQMEPNNNIQQPAVAQPAKQDSNSQKTASATAPNYAETSEPLELKGIKIGMTAQELLKLYPQAKVKTYEQQSAEWVFADQLVSLGFQDEVYLGAVSRTNRNS